MLAHTQSAAITCPSKRLAATAWRGVAGIALWALVLHAQVVDAQGATPPPLPPQAPPAAPAPEPAPAPNGIIIEPILIR